MDSSEGQIIYINGAGKIIRIGLGTTFSSEPVIVVVDEPDRSIENPPINEVDSGHREEI